MSTSHKDTRMLAKAPSPHLSLVSGSSTPQLLTVSLGSLVEHYATNFRGKTAAVFTWQNHRLTYDDLARRSRIVAKSMLASGLQHGDCVAIMAGNCYQYIETFLAAARIGCPFVVLNNTYSPRELTTAIAATSCKMLFLASNIGPKDMSAHLKTVNKSPGQLEHLIHLSDHAVTTSKGVRSRSYSAFTLEGQVVGNFVLQEAESGVSSSDVLNLQFTSGTTGAPKAAMLTHSNLINNGYLVGTSLGLAPRDIVCCPPPLFHCFGLVMGFLGALTHGSTIVFPCDQFEPNLVLDAVVQEKCTVLYGVPTMFVAELEANKKKRYRIESLRAGLAAGSSVPVALMRQLSYEFGVKNMTIAYGMTETSPVTFMTALSDSEEKRLTTVGQVMPHTMAKVVDRDGKIVPRGVPGELCTSGYSLQQGYWKNQAKTDEVMKRDTEGRIWMYTGDECVIDGDGYCSVTGRIKDLIIRGGENIFPVEIEERLLEHACIAEASVVAIKDEKYGEVVGAFLRPREQPWSAKPDFEEVRTWVRKTLGSHKAPNYVFWVSEEGFQDFPKTGSGKYQKHILRDIGDRIVKTRKQNVRARL